MTHHPTRPGRPAGARLPLGVALAALALGCGEVKNDSSAGDDTAPQVDTFGGPCDPAAAAWSEGDYQQIGVLVDVGLESCSAVSGHDASSFLSFDQMDGVPLSGSAGAGLELTGTDPAGHVGESGYTLEDLELGQALTVFLSDDQRDYTALLTLDAVGISGVSVTWTEQP